MKEKFAWIGNAGGVIFTAIQTNEIFQIISLILTCVATLLSISITIYNLVKKAKQGKLEEDDLKKALDEINHLKEQLEKEREEHGEIQ